MQENATVYAGVDTHKDFHVLVILDSLGRFVSSGSFSASEEGYRRLAEEIGDPSGCLAVGMEGTASYGAGLCSHLMESGYAVFEVLRPKKEKRRVGEGKTDGIDAERAARAVAAGKGVVPKSHNGWVEGLRALTVARSVHVSTMTGAADAASPLPVSAPEQARAEYGPPRGAGLYRKLGACRPSAEDDVAGPLLASLKALARTWLGLNETAGRPEGAMRRLIEANAPALLQVKGCGVSTPRSSRSPRATTPSAFRTKRGPLRPAACPPSPPPAERPTGAGSTAAGTDRQTKRST